MASRYRPGDHALVRFVWPWKVFWALPATVVEHTADIWVLPDRSWRCKDEDEDELEAAVGTGLFTPHEAKAIREEGERVIERVEAWTEPFNEGWEEWRPDPDWPLPSVPEGWDRL